MVQRLKVLLLCVLIFAFTVTAQIQRGRQAASNLTVSGTLSSKGIITGIKTITNADSPYTVLSTDNVIFADSTSGSITVTIAAAAGLGGREFTIIKTVAANTVTFDANASELIGAATTDAVTVQYTSRTYVSNSVQWFVK